MLGHIDSILSVCLEHCPSTLISHDMLESLLLPLLPGNKAENQSVYNLVQAIMRRSFASLRAPLTAYLNNLMASSMSDNKDVIAGNTNMEILSGQLYPLLYELHQITPNLMIGIIPNLCMQLQAEEEDIRIKGVQVLSTLFSSSNLNNVEMTRYIKDFLSRFGDISANVRIAMIDQAAIFMKNKPDLFAEFEGMMQLYVLFNLLINDI